MVNPTTITTTKTIWQPNIYICKNMSIKEQLTPDIGTTTKSKKTPCAMYKKNFYLSRYFSDWIPQLKTPAIAAVFSIVQYNKIKTNNKNNERKKFIFHHHMSMLS